MMIGVVSDTHSKKMPSKMLEDFRKVDFIIHAGDFCCFEDYKVLAKIKPVKGVYGNMDDGEIQKLFPQRQIFSWGSFTIGIVHGEGPPKRILEQVKTSFQEIKVDVIIFGHSHQPINQKIEQVLYFNPGSPTDTIFAPYCSYGFLQLKNNQIVGDIIKV